MLLQNITLNNQYPYRRRGATATNTETGYMMSQHGTGGARQFHRFMVFNKRSGFPTGYNPGIYMPLKHSEISSYREADYNISATAAGLRGYPIVASSSFAISVADATGELIASGVGSGQLSIYTNTPLMTASLSGVGSTSFSFNTNSPLLGGEASIVGGTSFQFSASCTPYATGALAGTAFLAGGEIDEFAVLGRMEYDNAVHVDAINGGPGTSNPVGTLASPVNNITDALTIARGLNLTKIKFLSDYTLSAGDNVSGYTLVSDSWKVLTVETGAVTTDTVFERLSLYGELCGTWNTLIDCWTYNITNFLGWVRGGSIERVELAPYLNPDPFSLGSSYFDDVVPMYADIKSVLVMNTAVSVSFTNCTDIVEIQNMEEGEVINIALSGGQVIIDSTCVGGDVHISGVGVLEDNSSGPVVDSVGLLNDLEFIIKTITNKREIKEESNRTTLIIYDDNGVTPILQKVLKDISGERISALAAGTLAREEAMSI